MNEVFVIDREFLFRCNIHEITSISIEHNFDIDGTFCLGEFIVSGDYRLHEISINKEDFSFKIPFNHEIKSNINLDSVEVEITDFNYEFTNGDELKVHLEYVVSGEQSLIEFEDEKDLDEFLKITEAEVIDFSDTQDVDVELPKMLDDEDDVVLEDKSKDEVRANVIEVAKKEDTMPEKIDENMFLKAINDEESYVKYHVHTVTMEDSLESICAKYATSVNVIKKYNTFEALELNMKLLIPENEEN